MARRVASVLSVLNCPTTQRTDLGSRCAPNLSVPAMVRQVGLSICSVSVATPKCRNSRSWVDRVEVKDLYLRAWKLAKGDFDLQQALAEERPV